MATFWKRPSHLVNRIVFFVLRLFILLVISHFCFIGYTVVLVVLVPGHYLPYFTFPNIEFKKWLNIGIKNRLILVSFNHKGLQFCFVMLPLEGSGHCFCTIILLQWAVNDHPKRLLQMYPVCDGVLTR